jgi:hypothetical protein
MAYYLFLIMISMADQQGRQALINRIQKLDENSTPLWGKMTVFQMLKHCSQWEELALGKQVYKQIFLGRLFGKIALKSMMKDEPVKRNMPTVPSFVITGDGNVALEKENLITLIEAHAQCTNGGFIHPFFGKLSFEEGIYIASKHLDHHLKQFNV